MKDKLYDTDIKCCCDFPMLTEDDIIISDLSCYKYYTLTIGEYKIDINYKDVMELYNILKKELGNEC